MAGVVGLVGDEVLGKNGKVKVEDACKGKKAIGLYFSAHWCPPCRGFTPNLAEFYKKVQGELEIIFISSDRDEASFNEYYAEMPWLALPFQEREKKEELGQKYGVRGIPTLVIVKENGETVTTEGRGHVASSGGAFPDQWK